MKTYLRKIRGVSLITIFALCIIIGGIYIFINRDDGEADMSSVERDIRILTETYPTQFVVYGEMIDFDSSIKVKYVEEINEETLRREPQYVYSVIIVNDLTGKVTLSDEEWGMISELVKSDNTYNLFYLGNEDIDQLLRTEVISSLSMWEGRDLSIAVTHEGPDVITVFGTYYENAGFSLPEAILAEQVFSIRQSN